MFVTEVETIGIFADPSRSQSPRCIFHWLCSCTAPRPPGPAGTRLGGGGRGSKPLSDHRPCRAPATPAGKTSAAGSARRRSEVRGGSAPRRAPVSGPAPAPTSPGLYQGLSRSGLTSGPRPRQREGSGCESELPSGAEEKAPKPASHPPQPRNAADTYLARSYSRDNSRVSPP